MFVYFCDTKQKNNMKESILKLLSAFMPLSLWCCAVEEPRAASILFFIGLFAALELTYIYIKK